MDLPCLSEYNRDQLVAFNAIDRIVRQLPAAEIARLKRELESYLQFRRVLEQFYRDYFEKTCLESCFESRLSACCGFESIIIFFSDQVINYLVSEPEDMAAIFRALRRRNDSRRCVYLGAKGCLWRMRPIACAMFFCEQAKARVFSEFPQAREVWADLQRREKEFTLPTKPVLFDDLEAFFMERGAEAPNLYFHNSPGLLRLKAAGKAAAKKKLQEMQGRHAD